MGDFTCHKCEQVFSMSLAPSGAGKWSLYACPHCGQMYTSGSVPATAAEGTIHVPRTDPQSEVSRNE